MKPSPQPHNPLNPQNSLKNDIISHKVIEVEGVVGLAGNDRFRVMARARAYVAKCPPAVSGSNGHGQLLSVTCALWNGFALEAEDALEILREYNLTCDPPWEEKDLRHKVRQAEEKIQHRQPRGHLLGSESPARKAPPYESAEPSLSTVWKVTPKPLPAALQMSTAPVEAPTLADDLVAVDGCRIPRPVEIEVTDETWRTVEAAGFADDPQIQNALFLFGPGCTVTAEPPNAP